MVMATRSGFDGVDSFAGCVPAAAGDRDGNSVTWLVRDSLAPFAPLTLGEGENAAGAAGDSAGSNAGATAVAIAAGEALTPSKRFQSDGAGERFQMFDGDSG